MNRQKIKDIQKRIDRQKTITKDKNIKKNTGTAFNIAVELVAGAIAGIIMGIFLDNLFDSKPWFLGICLILSFAAAFRSILNKI